MLKRIVAWIIVYSIFWGILYPNGDVYAEPFSNCRPLQRVAIIGGGMAGVSAATFLQNTQCHVHLFEAAEKLGGHAQTACVENGNGEQVEVDLGPQYFSKGPWDIYVDFLKCLNLYKKEEFFSFSGGLTAFGTKRDPYFVSPSFHRNRLRFNLHIDKIRMLYTFYRFNNEAYKLYKTKNESNYTISVGQWLDRLHFEKEDQEKLILPFLGSLIGVDRHKARELSIYALVRLFAFGNPLNRKDFKVLIHGMGNLINDVGTKLEKESKNIIIHRGTPVREIIKNNDQYLIRYERKDGFSEEILVDKVITALHPFQLIPLLSTFPKNDLLKFHLSQLEYVDNRIVLHRSVPVQRNKLSSVIDINSNQQGATFLTMNLEKIDSVYFKGIHKSWVNTEESYDELRRDHCILVEAYFKHPIVTTDFFKHRNSIRHLLNTCSLYTNLQIAGGWTEMMETQATAILSGYKAVKKLYPDIMLEKKWEEALPSLRKYAGDVNP